MSLKQPVTSLQGDHGPVYLSDTTGKDILEADLEDEVLALKTHLVNDANDKLVWTTFHWKLFFLNGFGYAVDSLLTMVQGVTGPQAFLELATASSYINAGVVAQNVGLVLGALFWGFGADMIGRRLAFNLTLWITSLAMIVAGASPNLPFLGAFLALSTFGSGGNLILDPTVLLEFLPGDKQWVVTALAGWWGFGQSITGFVAWGFMTQSRWNCSANDNCGWSNNAGWRYVMFTCGALVFVLSVLRVTVIRLVETPKYLLANGRDADLVTYYQDQARKYNRPCSLTLDNLRACGQTRLKQREEKTFIFSDIKGHVQGLFVSRKTTLSTILIWVSWAIMGLAYPLFYVFLPAYLSTRVPGKAVSQFETYRNLTLTTVSGIPGPLIAGYLVTTRLGRKYTMFIGALAGMALFFGITGIRTNEQNVGISCAISCCINIYYSTFYAYTAEVLPSAHRATGSGIAVSFNRLMGIVSAFVASSGNTATAVPLYVCAALFGGLAIIAALFPFEPHGRRSS
ncbi:major facilitator superfamily transporter [Fusarium albosuccineum]|uniref:Major facilitator superfamily transporter n=1 Tax=Fusarium albosuccineum TaxID=1237068 RepID=A0A8H4LPT8_9HYPO|nr:major facilitator superfamily transporter [Fusarium albosuccineum]